MFNPNAKICQQNTFNSTISHHWAHSVKSLAMARLSRLGGGLLVSSPAMALAIKPSWSYLIIILITSIRPCIAQQWIGKSPWIHSRYWDYVISIIIKYCSLLILFIWQCIWVQLIYRYITLSVSLKLIISLKGKLT